MYKKSIYLAIALSIIITACGDTTSFTVDETKYRLDKHCPDIQINEHDYFKSHKGELKYIETENCNPQNPICRIDDNKYDFKYNFENNICPTDFPKCIANTEPNNPGFHCEAEARKGCEKDGINYEHNDSICENETVQKGKVSTCNNGTWDTAQCETSCNSKGNGCGECVNDEEKYVNDDSNNQSICKHAKCVNGSFDFDHAAECAEHVSCKLENGERKCGDCINGAFKCDADFSNIFTCSDGEWKKTSCPDNTKCHMFGTKAECNSCTEEGQKRYDNDEKGNCIIQVCNNVNSTLEWQETDEKCPSDFSCIQNTDIKKSKCGECRNGSTQCITNENGSHIQVCENGSWIDVVEGDCSYDKTPVSCNNARNRCGECLNGTTRYENKTDDEGKLICHILLCQDGQWLDMPQDYKDYPEMACHNKVSCQIDIDNNTLRCGECLDNQSECIDGDSGGQIRECINGQWINTITCTKNKSLINCANDKECGKCQNGDIIFENETDKNPKCIKKVCKDANWIEDKTFDCNSSCDTSSQSKDEHCGECINSRKECLKINGKEGYETKTCIDGKWQAPVSCNNNSCKVQNNSTTECGECINETTKFEEDSHHICSKYLCKDGVWITDNTDKPKENVSCNETFEGYGECLNETTKCSDDKQSLIACVKGKYINSKCPADCANNKCTEVDCTGEYPKCDNGFWYECQNQKVVVSACLLGICQNESKCTECLSDQCSDKDGIGYLQKCDNGSLETETPCHNNYSCRDNACGNCQNGQKQCIPSDNGNIISICENGDWTPIENCGSNSCKSDNTCGECTDKAERCIDNNQSSILQICKNGRWEKDSICPNNASCSNSESCGDCKNGEHQCTENKNNVSVIQICEEGKWKDESSCGAYSCSSNTECGTCKNNTNKYENQIDRTCMQYNCVEGNWIKDESFSCSNSCKNTNNINIGCGDCLNYEYRPPTAWHVNSCYNGTKRSYSCFIVTIESIGDYYKCIGGSTPKCYNVTKDGITTGYLSKDKPCSSNYSCRVIGDDGGMFITECGECSERTTRCRDSLTQQTCVNGTWAFPENCENGCANDKCK